MRKLTAIFIGAALCSCLAGSLKAESAEELSALEETVITEPAAPRPKVKVYTNDDLTVSTFRRPEASTLAGPEAAAIADAPSTTALVGSAAPSAPALDKDPGELNIVYQSYYNRLNNSSIANVNGASISYLRFFPKLGLFSAHLEPLVDRGGLTTGENYLQWKGLPWKGRHWDFALGDFHFNGAAVPSPFTNIIQTDFFLRGASVTARTRAWRYSLFGGVETLTQGERVPFRTIVPQHALGAEVAGTPWSWLTTGFRYLHLGSSSTSVLEKTSFFPLTRQFVRSDSLTAQASIRMAKDLEWYTETSWNNTAAVPHADLNPAAFSFTTGPSWKTSRSVVRANYVRQGIGYLPTVGYFLGDRRGPAVDATLRLGIFDVYGAWGQTRNNLERNPAATNFFSRQKSAGVNVRLPFRFGLNGSVSKLDLETHSAVQPDQLSNNRQLNINLTRPVWGHNLRVGFQQLDLQMPDSRQRLRFLEVEDTFRVKRFSLSGAVRLQRSDSGERRNSLYFRGGVQFQLRNVNVYTYLEQGKDLANSTLFATNVVSTSVAGLSWQAPRGLSVQLEAFRNLFNSNLNPANIFVLASQGIPVDLTLSRFNNWSAYLRITRHFGWGERLDVDASGNVRQQAPITGKVAGFVRLRTMAGDLAAPNVTVNLPSGKQAVTDEKGYFEFADVPQGTIWAAVDIDSLPSEFNPADPERASVLVRPDQVSRVELAVIPLQSITGTILDQAGVPAPDGVPVRLEPESKYTTTDKQGRFGFYDLPEGDYTVILQENSLPENAQVTTPSRVPVTLRYSNASGQSILFEYRIVPPEPKPLRNVLQGERRLINYQSNSSEK